MWWVLIIPGAVWLGKAIYDAVASEEHKKHEESPSSECRALVVFEERGHLRGDKVVVVGRTGAGKSSLINMLHGKQVLPVGPVAATTRWIEGVRVKVGQRQVVFVDTPGYGEVFTAEQYADGLANWLKCHRDEVVLMMMVIQADAKAHAEDKRILARLTQANSDTSVVLVLTQVDKLFPVREPLEGKQWSPQERHKSPKSKQIVEKIRVICEQFGIDQEDLAPSAADGVAFNRRKLLQLITERLSQRQ